MSEIRFHGEFSWEMLFAVSHAYKAYLDGELSSTRGCGSTKPFYYFSDNHKENLKRRSGHFMTPTIKVEKRINNSHKQTVLDYHAIYEHDLDISNLVFPPYKDYYLAKAKSLGIKFDNPVLVINNKSAAQWGQRAIIDRIELEELSAVVQEFSDHDIIYIRPIEGIHYVDNQGDIPFKDMELMREFPNVYVYDDLMRAWSVDFNVMQLICHSLSDKHLSVAGGNAILASHFGGINVVVSKHKESLNRGIWQTDSYLKNISGSTIVSATNTSQILAGLNRDSTTEHYPNISLVKEEGVFEKIDAHALSFDDIKDVYLGSTDPVHIPPGRAKKIQNTFNTSSNIFATCGGFFSLSVLHCFADCKVNDITFFDVNPHSVSMAKYVMQLIENSKDVKSFLEKYLMLNVKKNLQEEYILLPTSQEDRDRMFDENNKYHNETSASVFYAISKSPYDINRVYLLGFMNVGGAKVGELVLGVREDNVYTNQNTLGVGYGWLSSDQSFLAVKNLLQSSKINFLHSDIVDIKCSTNDIILSSNIARWTRFSKDCTVISASPAGYHVEHDNVTSCFPSVQRINTKAIYTVIVGDSDTLKEPELITDGWDYVCFTDSDSIQSNDSVWTFKPIPPEYNNEDAKRTASLLKIEFYKLFNAYDLVVYVDASTTIEHGIGDFINDHNLSMVDMAVVRHPDRDCTYACAEAVAGRLKLANKDIVRSQISRYKEDDYPANNGLMTSGLMIRYNKEGIRRACEIWSTEYRNGCRRDQVSMTYSFWKAEQIGYRNTIVLLNYADTYNGVYFSRGRHKTGYEKNRRRVS